jgi:16S rRNA (cytosine967-C5)-methyltransferase
VNETAALVLARSAQAIGHVVFSGASADDVLRRDAASVPAVRAIALGTLRWYWRLKAILDVLLERTQVSSPVRSLLWVSLHQLEYSRNPPEPTVSSAVDAVRILKQPRASGLVNALLRRFLRERAALLERALTDEASAAAHPRWLFDRLREHWPSDWQSIVECDNSHPPMTLRVNLKRGSREHYQARLHEQDLEALSLPWAPAALILKRPVGVSELPGFAQGDASVQDAGAQLASILLDAAPGDRVLDACAAPGGKTAAILERSEQIDLSAVDIDASRAARISDTLRRIGAQARVFNADLRTDVGWWDGQPFQRILLDAPCSATGVIRRHPDIKLLRRAADIPSFAQTQRRLLEQCLTWLAPGGRLVYCTCSLIPDENEAVVDAVLASTPRARLLPLPSGVVWPPHAVERRHGMQLLPGSEAQTDGFYYACLTVT